jgi:Tol biopolymer transport system component
MGPRPRRKLPSLCLALAASCLAAWPAAAATLDPTVRLYTLETPHFRVNYQEGYDAIARKAAAFAEEAHDRVSRYMGATPTQKTELTLFDHEDSPGGMALPYVNNAIYVNLTAPDSDFLWGRYDDWLKMVITHEYTHTLHFETVEGVAAGLNKVFGRFLFPNMWQPPFLIEGLAVTVESLYTNEGRGGRGHESYFDMYLRADALEGRQLTIDQVGTYHLTEFPSGDACYVYGTYFYRYIVERYGADKPPAIAHAFARSPWLGIDHAVAEVLPGRDTMQIWDEMSHWLRRRSAAQLAAIRRQPVTLTRPVTTTGMHHRHPSYLPDGTLVFVEGLRHGPPHLVALRGQRNGQPVLERLARKSQTGAYDLSRDGRSMYYADSRGRNNYSSFDDVFRHDFDTHTTTALTDYARIAQPGISPDGKQLLAVRGGRGQSHLLLLDAEGRELRQVTAWPEEAQITAPRWSPDGGQVVFSAWHAGTRDLYLVDTATWHVEQLWRDDDVDTGPVWTPDQRHILFASDREGGVYNIFAYDWQAGTLARVTNVPTGVCEPAVRPDGKELAVAYCRGFGWDIHTLPLDPATWAPVPTPGHAAPSTLTPPRLPGPTLSGPYSPVTTLLPKLWLPLYQANPASIGAFTLGYDVVLTNLYFAHVGWALQGDGWVDRETGAVVPVAPLDRAVGTFLYQNTQYDINWNLLASVFPNRYNIPLRDGTTLTPMQRFATLTAGLGWNNLPSPLTNASYQVGDVHALNFNVRLIQDLSPPSERKPLEGTTLIPPAGRSHSLSYAYRYNDNGRFGYSISPEHGTLGSWGVEVAHPWLGSQVDYYRGFLDHRRFWGLPWTHHVLALRGMLGLNFGRPQGDFYLGGTRPVNQAGTPDIRVAADPDDMLVGLRGYPLASVGGNAAGLLAAEYRFPLAELQHGLGTLPFLGERLSGALFCDAGTAWTNDWARFIGREQPAEARQLPTLADTRVGVGGEVRLHFKIHNNPLNTNPVAVIGRSAWPALNALNDSAGILRLGVAQGLVAGADGQPPPPAAYFDMGTYF